MGIWIFYENGQFMALAVFYLWQTALCFLFLRIRERTRLTLRLAVLLSLLPLLSVKLGDVFPVFHMLQMLGISYMTFRGVQVLIDVHDGKLKELRLPELSYFLLFSRP